MNTACTASLFLPQIIVPLTKQASFSSWRPYKNPGRLIRVGLSVSEMEAMASDLMKRTSTPAQEVGVLSLSQVGSMQIRCQARPHYWSFTGIVLFELLPGPRDRAKSPLPFSIFQIDFPFLTGVHTKIDFIIAGNYHYKFNKYCNLTVRFQLNHLRFRDLMKLL